MLLRCHLFLFGVLLPVIPSRAIAEDPPLLKPSKTIALSPDINGHFDNIAVDLKSRRLFATPEDDKAVLNGQVAAIFQRNSLAGTELTAWLRGIVAQRQN